MISSDPASSAAVSQYLSKNHPETCLTKKNHKMSQILNNLLFKSLTVVKQMSGQPKASPLIKRKYSV